MPFEVRDDESRKRHGASARVGFRRSDELLGTDLRDFDYLDLIPHRWLHLTMQGVGMVEDVPDETRDRIVAAAREHLADLRPVRVEFRRPVVRAEAIALPPNPSSPVDAIRQAVRDGMADAIGTDAVAEHADGCQPT